MTSKPTKPAKPAKPTTGCPVTEDGETLDKQGIGLCVRRLDGHVLKQNEAGVAACGAMAGGICPKPTHKACGQAQLATPLAQGSYRFPRDEESGGKFDLLVINNSETVVTLMVPVKTPDIDSIDTPELSHRERTVLRKAVAGHTRAEIAVMLEVSENTVKTHMHNILKKLSPEARKQLDSLRALRGIVVAA